MPALRRFPVLLQVTLDVVICAINRGIVREIGAPSLKALWAVLANPGTCHHDGLANIRTSQEAGCDMDAARRLEML
jgi:hypothetical protein